MIVNGIGSGGGLTPVNVYESLGGSGGGGTGETLRWAADTFSQTAAFASGALSLPLSHTPIDNDSLTVWSQGIVLHPSDYTILTGPNRVQLNFAIDPATDSETGTWYFVVRYQYSA